MRGYGTMPYVSRILPFLSHSTFIIRHSSFIILRFLCVSVPLWFLLSFLLLASGCAQTERRTMETTAYCGCGECCGWERGAWKFWSRHIASGPQKGQPYSGRTASGTKPHAPHPGLFSLNSVTHPWMIPVRIVFFPWLLLPRDGTIAADTRYYSFGTEILVPGWGWGEVEDRGSAIKGPDRLDLYFRSHGKALEWGRKRVEVKIRK